MQLWWTLAPDGCALLHVARVRAGHFVGLSLTLLFVQLLDGLDLLLQLHSSVLKPYFNLSLRQAECVGHFDAPSSRQVVICVEFLLQLQCLVSSVRLPATTPQSRRSGQSCRKQADCQLIVDADHPVQCTPGWVWSSWTRRD